MSTEHWSFLRPSRSTKKLGLVLIGGSLVFGPTMGCSSSTPAPEDQVAAASHAHTFPPWWWWYMHRPYFVTPMYSSHTVAFVGSGGTYVRTGTGMTTSSYSSARSVSGAKSGGGSFKGGSSISARGGFSGGHGAAS